MIGRTLKAFWPTAQLSVQSSVHAVRAAGVTQENERCGTSSGANFIASAASVTNALTSARLPAHGVSSGLYR